LELQNILINPVQRNIKRQVERELFSATLAQEGLDASKAKARLHWGAPQQREVNVADLLKAAESKVISREEFRKNATKFGWELLPEPQPTA
jgi:hypothetical protein